MTKTIRLFTVALLASLAMSGAASAAITDPAGDFLASYTGAKTADLDIVSASVTFNGANFNLSATANGALGGTPGAVYVFAINRGGGTARIAGEPGLIFDALGVLFPSGDETVVVFNAPGPPSLVADFPTGATISGSTISAVIPLSLLTPNGVTPENYAFSMWVRNRVNPAADGGITELADFAPDASTFKATPVPEPASWALMMGGFGLIGGALRRRARLHSRPA